MRLWTVRLWTSVHWGLLNLSWGLHDKWGIHFLIVDRDQWHWGYFDEEYDCLVTYWGLGPLGCISRTNF